MKRALLFPAALVCMSLLSGQTTRTQELEQRREKEGGAYGDDQRSALEDAANWLEDHRILERFTRGVGGLRIVIGNLMPSSGFALGPEYFRDDLKDGAVQFRAGARGSMKRYALAEAELGFPRLLERKAYVDLYTRWRNSPGVPYYGPGPDSKKSGRTAFRLEDASWEASFGAQPVRGMRLGATTGFLKINVGPASDSRYASADATYSPAQVPGLREQTDFLRTGLVASYDWRDYPSARYGGFYEARFDWFHDRTLKRYSHRRLTLEAQQYIPFTNRRRSVALRAKTLLTYDRPGQTTPFYMQPVLGGQNDMRGFRFGRFYDNNALVMNGEYRWEIFSGLDGALFYDAGKVFPKRSQFNLKDLEGSAGFGLRVNAANSTFMRVDVGFSHEGFQVWISFNDLFHNAGGVAQSLYSTRAATQ